MWSKLLTELLKPLDTYGHRPAGEGGECSCGSIEAHAELVASIDASFLKDGERRRNAPTSQTMRNKVAAQLNGHATTSI